MLASTGIAGLRGDSDDDAIPRKAEVIVTVFAGAVTGSVCRVFQVEAEVHGEGEILAAVLERRRGGKVHGESPFESGLYGNSPKVSTKIFLHFPVYVGTVLAI